MKLTCNQENLTKGLGIVGRAVANTSLPITNNIFMEAEKDHLKLMATNLEMAIVCKVEATTTETGSLTVPAKLLTEFVNSLPPEKIEMSANKTLSLNCARFKARINGLDAKDFPPIPKVDGISTSIDSDVLKQAINHVVFAASPETSRPVLTGVDFRFDGDTLTLAAADGFRMAIYKLKMSKPLNKEVIIPAKTLIELNRLMTGGTVELIISSSHVLFKFNNIELVSSVLQGSFPKYEQLIPTSVGTRSVVDVVELRRAVRSASVFTSTVRLNMSPAKLTLSGISGETGENTVILDATVTGPELTTAYNGKYLMDALNVIQTAQISIDTTSPISPSVIKPVNGDYIYLIMPMHIST